MNTKSRSYKQTEIGEIPEDWSVAKLEDYVAINPSRTLKKGQMAKYIPMTNIQPFEKKVFSHETKPYNGGSKFNNKDTLLARITPCLENGKTAYVDVLNNDEVGFGSTEFIVLGEKGDKTDSQFIYYLARSQRLREIAIKSMVGSSGRQRVQTDKLAQTFFAFPALLEQQQIASFPSSLDDKIEFSRRMNKTLEEIGKALFKRWFVDFEFPNEEGKPYKSSGGEMVDSELGEIPKGWEVKPLDGIADFLNGLACQKYPPMNDEESLPVIKIAELRRGFTDSSDKATSQVSEEYIVNNGDVLFSWSGSLEICLWSYGRGVLNQHLFKVTSKEYPKWFFYYWLLYFLPEFRAIASGKATTMGHIQRKHLKTSLVLVPDKSTLKKIDLVMQPVLDNQIINNSEISNLGNIRDSLLPRLMSGKLRVN